MMNTRAAEFIPDDYTEHLYLNSVPNWSFGKSTPAPQSKLLVVKTPLPLHIMKVLNWNSVNHSKDQRL